MKHDPYLKNLNYAIFDIETTGLSPVGNMVISASFYDPKTEQLLQLFSEDPAGEEQVLRKTAELLSARDAVITYNGRSFDLPFVKARAKKYGIDASMPLLWNADLYLWLKKYWPMAELVPSLRQKAVEEILGVEDHRTDEIGGAECISLYSRYLQLGRPQDKETILLHNGDDVRQLAKICDKINFLPWHDIAFHDGFFARYENGSALLGPAQLKQKKVQLKAKTLPGSLPASFFDDCYTLEYDSFTGNIALTLFAEQKGDLLFADLDRLPVRPGAFADLVGFHEGFLVLAREQKPLTRECNRLAYAILQNLFK
ncbi:MAG: ribonuclease H-like domain-containing protein [Firmicutes bacterium]|nr:ribonuclease H-like domain-containing protein [Bacillota bacterium]